MNPLESIWRKAKQGQLDPIDLGGWTFSLYTKLGTGPCLCICPTNIYLHPYIIGLDEIESPTHLNLLMTMIKDDHDAP
jgi:hypothetical protein